jgi:hypothetical protein
MATPWILATLLTAAQAQASAAPPVLRAVRLGDTPNLDGDVLGDPAWAGVSAADAFWQTTPEEGRPASERTELRVGYTANGLYVAVVCHDREPAGIVVADSRRDASLDETDSVRLVLDTFLDRQNGFVFGTNPAGIEYDAQLVRQGGDRGDELNLNWDGVWAVRTRSDGFGWSAEFEIPWKTLRYPRAPEQSWGLNVQRNIRRRNESAFWAPLQRQHGIARVSSAGLLEGIEPPSQRNLKLSPYVLAEVEQAPRQPRREDGQLGGDLKWSATPSLTLDLSVNTDFAQVEADEQQVNLDRFSLFFPEKRPFFLENAGFFSMGVAEQAELFFSRRIGLGPEGVVVPILGGGRLSGRALGLNVGLLDMQTKRVIGLTHAQNFGALRLEKELRNRSGIALLFTNRTATGEGSAPGDTGRTFGAEGRLGIGRYFQLHGFGADTDSAGVSADDHAYRAGAYWSSPAWEGLLEFTELGEGFDPQLGFLARRGYRRPAGRLFHSRRMQGWLGLHEVRPHVSYEGYWKPGGFQESGFLHADTHWEWRSGFEVHTAVNFTQEGLRERFEIAPGVDVPPGSYAHKELHLVVITNQGAPLSLDFTGFFGGYFGGTRRSWNPILKARRGEQLNLQLSYQRNDVNLPAGSFTTNLLRTRLAYSFSPRLSLQALVQYNDQSQLWSTNLRLAWLRSANTGLFVVYNEGRDTAGPGSTFRDRSVIVKWSQLVDLLD